MSTRAPIPQEWIRDYVDTLLAAAKHIGPNTVMGKATLERAEHAMDLVKAFRESLERQSQ